MLRTVVAATLSVSLAATACVPQAPPPASAPATPTPSAIVPTPTASGRLPVGVREIRLTRGADRPLRTLLLYPTTPALHNPVPDPAPAEVVPRTGHLPRPGRYPLVLFSHGLQGSPERYAPAAASWAAAGFVVAVPAFPYTNKQARPYRRDDYVNQPDDAAHVLRAVIALDTTPGDPLHGHIDTSRIGAVGHSAGGYTTVGLLRAGHDPRLRAAVVIAGWLAPGAFHGSPAAVMFLHGDDDVVVPLAEGRAAYLRVPAAWGRSFRVMPGVGHAAYMLPGRLGYAEMDRQVTAFLRLRLGDPRG